MMRLLQRTAQASTLWLVALIGCQAITDRQSGGPSEAPPEGASGSVPTTALISIDLSRDGTARFDMVAPRSFAFNGARLAWPMPAVAASLGLASAPAVETATPAAGVLKAAGPALRDLRSGPKSGARYFLVAHPPGGASPEAVSLELGDPTETKGDVVSHWQSGSLVVRAPYHGKGTRYALVAAEAEGERTLAEIAP